MQNSPQRRSSRAARYQRSGRTMVGAAALVLAALVVVPWITAALVPWPQAPTLAAFLALLPALYLWFRRVQQTSRRTAALLAVVHAAVAAAVLWLWRAP